MLQSKLVPVLGDFFQLAFHNKKILLSARIITKWDLCMTKRNYYTAMLMNAGKEKYFFEIEIWVENKTESG